MTMVRLLPLLLFLIVGLVLLMNRQAAPVRSHEGRTYRPRSRSRSRARDSTGGVTLLRRRDLAGLRDAYSGESLDASRPLVHCDACQSVYHADSARILARENGGRCVGCNKAGFSAVRVIAD
jgi:hypothetical protein